MPSNAYKDSPVTQEYETKAKNILKGELKTARADLRPASRNVERRLGLRRTSET